MRQRSLKELFLDAGDGPIEDGLVEVSSGSSASKLRLQDLRSRKRKVKVTICKMCVNVRKKFHVIPDNLENVTDSCFFFWDMQTIRTGSQHKVVLATVLRNKLKTKGPTKQSSENYSTITGIESSVSRDSCCFGDAYILDVPL